MANPRSGSRPLIIDGGVGSEFEKRNVEPHRVIWTGLSHMSHPDVALAIHEDYLRAGADIITANTFCTSKHLLAAIGKEDLFETAIREAIRLARQARERVGRHALIAGSVSTIPRLDRPSQVARAKDIAVNYGQQAEILAESGADLIIVELIVDGDAGAVAIEACQTAGLPVWAGLSASRNEVGELTAFRTSYAYTEMPAESLSQMIACVRGTKAAAAGIMHTKIPLMDGALSELGQNWTGPKFAYAESGRFEGHRWVFDATETPGGYAAEAVAWTKHHALHAVGGCCGTGPEHIAALKLSFGGVLEAL